MAPRLQLYTGSTVFAVLTSISRMAAITEYN